MAWNAVLVGNPDERAGRSYMEHVAALADDPSAPAEICQAAQRLRDTPAMPPALITLGRPDLGPADAARTLIEFARQLASEQP